MTNVKGQKFLTVPVGADEIYEITYTGNPCLNFLNNTEGDVLISVQSDFPHNSDDTAGHYLTLPSGAAANAIMFSVPKCYIKASASGNVTIERCN